MGRGPGFPSNTMWPGPRPTCVPSFILIRPTVWPQYIPTLQKDTTDRQRFDSIGRTVLQTVAQKNVNNVIVCEDMNHGLSCLPPSITPTATVRSLSLAYHLSLVFSQFMFTSLNVSRFEATRCKLSTSVEKRTTNFVNVLAEM